MKKILKIILVFLGAAIALLFSPLASNQLTAASVLGMAIGTFVIICGIAVDKIFNFAKKKSGKIVLSFAAVILCLAVTVSIVFTCLIISAAQNTNVPDEATVIVLGCQIKNGKPGKMLRQRLDTACSYLNENPKAICILSGGKGVDEIRPEAEAMYDYLIEKGIDKDRLLVESNSKNTMENMLFSADMIKEYSLSNNIAVVTNSFHQYRAFRYAENAGLKAYAVNCYTEPLVLPTYWLRELPAIIKMSLSLTK